MYLENATLELVRELNQKSKEAAAGIPFFRHIFFIRQDKSLISTDERAGISVFDVDSGTQLNFRRRDRQIFCAATSPDGKMLATVDRESSAVLICNIDSLETVERGHSAQVLSVAIAPDGKTAVTGSWDGSARYWDLESGKGTTFVNTSRSELGSNTKGIVNAVAYSRDGRSYAAGIYESRLVIVDSVTQQQHDTVWDNNLIESIAFSPDSKLIAVGTYTPHDSRIGIFDCINGKQVKTLKGHTESVRCVEFTPDGKRLISSDRDATVRVWNIDSGISERTWKVNYTDFVAIHPDGKVVAFDPADQLKCWDINSGIDQVHYGMKHFLHLRAGVYMPDGKILIAAGGNEITFWDSVSGKQMFKFECPGMTSLSISKDGKLLLSGHIDSTALLWRIPDFNNSPQPSGSSETTNNK